VQESEFTGCANKVQGSARKTRKNPPPQERSFIPDASEEVDATEKVLRSGSAIRASWEIFPQARTPLFALR